MFLLVILNFNPSSILISPLPTPQVGRAPLQSSSVQWVFQGEEQKDIVLNEDVLRGGVMINTWRLDRDTLVSNLTLYRAVPKDKVAKHNILLSEMKLTVIKEKMFKL